MLKCIAGMCLLGILGIIYWVSDLYMDGANQWINTLFLSLIFLRCVFASSLPAQVLAKARTRRRYQREIILSMKQASQKTQRLQTVNDLIDRALLKDEQKKALKEIRLLKHQLIRRAHAKHNLAMAQINAGILHNEEQHESSASHPAEYIAY